MEKDLKVITSVGIVAMFLLGMGIGFIGGWSFAPEKNCPEIPDCYNECPDVKDYEDLLDDMFQAINRSYYYQSTSYWHLVAKIEYLFNTTHLVMYSDEPEDFMQYEFHFDANNSIVGWTLTYYNKTTGFQSQRPFQNTTEMTYWLYELSQWSGECFPCVHYPLSDYQKVSVMLWIMMMNYYEDTGAFLGG